MCGIFGGVGDWTESREISRRMANRLRHRGPDASGERRWAGVLLGHTRLRILDLSEAGDQPMGTPAGRIWVVFNGEIYNHRELRTWLEKRGHRFRGEADTEVIPHLYEELGPTFVERLRGMFAFALYDRGKSELLLCRDRFGIKPLFYAVGTGRVAFASEIGALREVEWIDFSPDPQSLYDLLGLRCIPAPATFFRGVRALDPGQMARVRNIGAHPDVEMAQFHEWSIDADASLDATSVLEMTAERLERAVASQLEADVPLGTFLSGGIDSSLVSAVAANQNGGLRTFNLRFPDEKYDETGAAIAVARHIGSEHRVLEMGDSQRGWEGIKSLVMATGQPFADTSIFGVDAVCRAARGEVTVALSGDGGDEGFSGYDAYRVLLKTGRLRKLLRGIPSALSVVPGLASVLRVVSPRMSEKVRSVASLDQVALVQRQFAALSEDDARALLAFQPALPVRRHFEPVWDLGNAKRLSLVDRLQMLATEVNVRLILGNDFLVKVDTASMRHSLEVRVPMLDEDLVDFALSLPWWLKVNAKEGKVPLRRLAARLLPEDVVDKPKHGFGVPLDLWFSAGLKRELVGLMLSKASPLFDVFRAEIFRPWLECFGKGTLAPGLRRPEMHLRVMLLLSVFVFLSERHP